MAQEAHLGAIVLAGGRSSRMGTAKAELDWHGIPLVARVSGILTRIAEPVVTVQAAGGSLPELPEGVLVAEDEEPDGGPVAGIAAGMRALEGRADRAFVATTDAPFLHPDFVHAVVAGLGDDDVAMPVALGHRHPLSAAYRMDLLPQVERLLAAGPAMPPDLLARVRTRTLGPDDLGDLASLRNLNTREEYRAALAEPEPAVTARPCGSLCASLGEELHAVRAATVERALAQLRLPGGALVALNGGPFADQGHTPLVAGDELQLMTAEEAG